MLAAPRKKDNVSALPLDDRAVLCGATETVNLLMQFGSDAWCLLLTGTDGLGYQ